MFDGPGRCVGVSVVGMRRAGRSAEEREEVEEVKAAYNALYRSGLSWRAAVDEIAANVATDAGRAPATFLQVPSKRGVAAKSADHTDERDATESLGDSEQPLKGYRACG